VTEWRRRIDLRGVLEDETSTFEEIRDEVVRRLRGSRWPEECEPAAGLVDELSETQSAEDFDFVWDELYDVADGERVWLATI
jgi:hypothetical protein